MSNTPEVGEPLEAAVSEIVGWVTSRDEHGPFPKAITTYARRLSLPAGMETRLEHPEWDAETSAAYWYWWPWSESWDWRVKAIRTLICPTCQDTIPVPFALAHDHLEILHRRDGCHEVSCPTISDEDILSDDDEDTPRD